MAPDRGDISINIGGDSTGGDRIATGDVAGEGIAIGRESAATVGGRVSDWISNVYQRLMDLERQILGLRHDVDELRRQREYEEWRQQYGQNQVSSTGLFVVAGLFLIAVLAVVFWLSMGYVPTQ